MSGLYIHIPFCKQACHYCDFHFSTSMRQKSSVVDALTEEMILQKEYLPGKTLTSIYFGGGTPSLLTIDELNQLFERIDQLFERSQGIEITLEANPDDLTEEKLKELAQTPINRLSIGVQSFFDVDLQFMNRAHNASEAINCIKLAQKVGFNNLTVDLIYGTPTLSNEMWLENIMTLVNLGIPHISSYCLTVEPKTALAHFVKTGKVEAVDDTKAAHQFDMLINTLIQKGFEHYEISNFAKPGMHARHNSNYWLGVPYLGIGPSAHSFDGKNRQWNISNNVMYIKAIELGNLPFEKESLTKEERYNEYVMTGLRTHWGVNLGKLTEEQKKYFEEAARPFVENKLMFQKEDAYLLTQAGKHQADRIAMELFLD
ncbi:MAG: radical SAM family heme chaperone HemW [Bacteroidota bacterium]